MLDKKTNISIVAQESKDFIVKPLPNLAVKPKNTIKFEHLTWFIFVANVDVTKEA